MINFERYVESVKQFIKDSKEWYDLDVYKHYVSTEYGEWEENADNANDGLDVRWAFHENPSIKEIKNKFIELCNERIDSFIENGVEKKDIVEDVINLYFIENGINNLMMYGADRDEGLFKLSEMYKKLMEKLDIKFDNVFTEDVSDGKYLTTIYFNNNKDIQIDTSAWNKEDVVIDNLNAILDYYYENINKKIKSMEDWQESDKVFFKDFFKPDDLVSEDVVEHFKNSLQVITNKDEIIQTRDPLLVNSENEFKYQTFIKEENNWKYIGYKFKANTIEELNLENENVKTENAKLKVIYKEVGKEPIVMEIDDTLEAKQKLVGGLIEVIPYKDNLLLICNEEGKMMDLNPNLQLDYDYIAGNCFVIGDDYENAGFKSIEEKQLNEIIEDLKDRSIELEEKANTIEELKIEKEYKNMNKYESIIILKPTLTEEELNKSINDYKESFEKLSNKSVNIENLGKKKLAYEVKGNKEGNYVIFNFYGKAEDIGDIERKYRIDDNVMKFITVRQEMEHEEQEDEEEL